MSTDTNYYYEEGDYVAVNLPGYKSTLKGTILNIIRENKSEYYLIGIDNDTLALVPKVDIIFRIP